MNKFVNKICFFLCLVAIAPNCYSSEEDGGSIYGKWLKEHELFFSPEQWGVNSYPNQEQQELAEFFGFTMFWDEDFIGYTSLYSLKQNDINGDRFLIHWYKEGYIATQISGAEKGKQMVVLNEEVVGISFPGSEWGPDKVNKYSWGVVYTGRDGQMIDLNPS